MIWMVTFVTHNSRVSERMVEYGVQRGEALIFSNAERVVMMRQIIEVCQRHTIPILTANILPDHVHMILHADDLDMLRDRVRKIKGGSAFGFQRHYQREKGHPTWAQKFHYVPLKDEAMLHDMMIYVGLNHQKHGETWAHTLQDTWARDLQPMIAAACVSIEAAFADTFESDR